MFNKKKKNNEPAKFGGGISTKSYKPQAKKKTEEASVITKKPTIIDRFKALPNKTRLIIVIALIVAILASIAVPVTIAIVRSSREKNFDYLKTDLSKYVDFSEEYYKDYPLLLEIAKPHKKNADGTGVSDVEISILYMLASDKGGKTIGGLTSDPTELTVGDDVYFWYRGYIIEDGKEIDVTSLMNFYKEESNIKSSSNVITLGGGAFAIAGVEGALIGLNTGDYAKFTKITTGNVKATQVVYISCERTPVGGSDADKQTGTCVRIDLTDADIAADWLPILEGAAVGSEVDDFTMNVGGVDYNYTKTKIEFVTECENGEGGLDPITVEGYAPYDFSITQLMNETVYLEIYIAGVQKRNDWHAKYDSIAGSEYTLDFDWNDDYVQSKLDADTLGISAEELDKYDGDTLTAKYESYAWETIMASYEENLKQMTEDAMWDYYLSRAIIKAYPQKKIDEVVKEYKDDLYYQYQKSSGYIYNMYTGEYVTCADVNEYAIIYFNLQYAENQDWEDYILRLCQSLIAERLIMYYIMQKENLTPSGAEFNARFEALKQEYLEEYMRQEGTDTSEMTEDQYKEYVAECEKTLFAYYDDEYFKETTYYELVADSMIRYANVYTLDDIPARDRWVYNIVDTWI